MSLAKMILEGMFNNTYGIEVEFGTHDNQALSFTHIEVCYLHPQGLEKSLGWKIETDADYTLEVVSPILLFESAQDARRFKDELMRHLESWVRRGILLGTLMNNLRDFVSTRFTFANDIWTFAQPQQALDLSITWIESQEMVDSLTWENWDEDTDLERVLAFRRVIEQEITQNAHNANIAMEARMRNILVTKSRKHGGLPSSQLNLPLELWAYVRYEVGYKREKAWKRLLQTETSSQKYIQEKVDELARLYPDLALNPVWRAKYLNPDYIESQIDEKTRFWHRYWLWLETFFTASGCLAMDEQRRNLFRKNYRENVNKVVDNPGKYYSVNEAKEILRKFERDTFLYFSPIDYTNDIAADILYLSVHKLAAGALSELSESLQMQAQIRIMGLNGDMTMDQIMHTIPDNQFMQFHYALKDLTSLWFKAPFFDVLAAENRVPGQAEAVNNAMLRLVQIGSALLSDIICEMLLSNLKLLGWYYSVCEANNQGFEYDWEEFCTYNMPNVAEFRKSVFESGKELVACLQNPDPELLYTYARLRQRNVVFLKRSYTDEENPDQNTPVANVAGWEGRWDTMKPVIDKNPRVPMYLIEHRNN